MIQRRGYDHRRLGTQTASAEETARNALLVVVFQEIQHMLQPLVAVLHPLMRDPLRRPAFARHATQIIVHAHFVVQIIEACRQISIIPVRIITFADEKELLVFLLHVGNGPLEELHRNHLRHIYPHTVYAFVCPKQQYITHFDPCVRYREELFLSPALIKDAVVQLHRLVPIVLARMTCKTVVSRHFCRKLLIALQVFVHRKTLARHVIEVVQRRKSPFRVIALA